MRTIETRLTALHLYDNSYLHTRNGIFYFSVRVSNLVTRISLHTDNLTLAIVLKLKIFQHLNLHNINPTTYFTFFDTDKLKLVKDFEIEKLLERVSKRIQRAIALQSDTVPTADKVEIIEKGILSDYTDEFISDKQRLGMSSKTLIKYKQSIEYLHIYFGANCKVSEIDYKAALGFSRFLFAVPLRWKNKRELRGKDLRLMIDKKVKLLNGLETLNIRTITEILKRVKAVFRAFENHGYIIKNYFEHLESIKSKKSEKREYKPHELKAIFTYLLREDKREDYNFMRFLLMSGLRRSEALGVQLKNINLSEYMIEVFGTKTENAHRVSIIHKDLVETIREQIADKEDNSYLFFDSEAQSLIDKPIHRDKSLSEIIEIHEHTIGLRVNKHIKGVLGADNKHEVDLHSLRRNYAQRLYMVAEIRELELKTLIGHSTSKDVTDSSYILGLRDNKRLKRLVDLADFSLYFD